MKTRRQFVQSSITGAATAFAAPSLLREAHAAFPEKQDRIQDAKERSKETVVAPTTDGVAPRGTIDWHNHWISSRAADLLKKRADAGLPSAPATPGRAPSSAIATGGVRPLSSMYTPIDERLKHLDQFGVERQVICWATTMGLDAVLKPDEARTLWSVFNEDLAELVRAHPDRFSGYAVLPTSDIAWAAKELERAHRDLGLIGAVLPVGAFQTKEGAKHLTPIFEVAQKYKGHIYLHSGPAYPTIPGQRTLTTPPDDAPGTRYNFEWASSYARGVVTVTQTDFLAPYPDVTIQIAMLGGMTPFLFHTLQTKPLAEGATDPAVLLRRVYLDASTSGASHTLDLAVQSIGADRILFGSDYGATSSVSPVVSAIRRTPLKDAEFQQIFVDNGRKLLAAKTARTA